MGTFLILLAFVGSEETRGLAIIFLISTAGILGFNTGGFFKSATLVGRQHSHFVNAIVQVKLDILMATLRRYIYFCRVATRQCIFVPRDTSRVASWCL